MSFAAVRAAAATALRTIRFDDGKQLRADAYITETINTPHAQLDFEDPPDGLTFGETAKRAYTMVVQVYDQRDSARTSLARLDELRDKSNPAGIKQVLEDGTNWPDDLVDYCEYKGASLTQVATLPPNMSYLMVEFRFEVAF